MTDATNTPGILKKAAAWLRGNGPAPAVSVGNPRGAAFNAQIDRLSGVVENAATRSDRAKRCHDDARRQIDSALYELDQLRLDLGAVVDPKLIARTPEAPAIDAKAETRAEPKVASMAGPARSERSAA